MRYFPLPFRRASSRRQWWHTSGPAATVAPAASPVVTGSEHNGPTGSQWRAFLGRDRAAYAEVTIGPPHLRAAGSVPRAPWRLLHDEPHEHSPFGTDAYTEGQRRCRNRRRPTRCRWRQRRRSLSPAPESRKFLQPSPLKHSEKVVHFSTP